MTMTRKFLTYAGPLWLLTLSSAIYAQNAPKAAQPATPAPAKAPAAAAPAPAKAPAAPAKAKAAAPATTPAPDEAVAPAPAVAPTSAAATGRASASGSPTAPATTTAAAGVTAQPFDADAHAALPPPAPPMAIAPPPPPLVEPAPAPPPPPAAPESSKELLPKKLAIANNGFLQIGFLAQTWFFVDDAKAIGRPRVDDPDTKTSTWDTNATFRFRRAQIKLSGDVVKDTVSYFVLFDLAKTLSFSDVKTNINGTSTTTGQKAPGDTSALLDFVITYKIPYVDFSIGQWKSTISHEGYSSSADLLLPERSFTARYFGDNYEVGAKAEKKFEYMKYSLQVLDGVSGKLNASIPAVPAGRYPAYGTVTAVAQTNQLDNNRQKDVVLRLEFTPVKGFMFGGAGLTSVGQRTHQMSTRDIVEGDVVIDTAGLFARGEFFWGWMGMTGNGFERTKSRGMVGSLGYTIAKKVQPVARIGYLNVDATTVGGANAGASQPLVDKFGAWYQTDEIRSYEFGLNYFIDGKYAKLQAAYAYLDFDNIPHRQQFTLSGQVSF